MAEKLFPVEDYLWFESWDGTRIIRTNLMLHQMDSLQYDISTFLCLMNVCGHFLSS
jgi:hypothetical protein